jgi:hypothetical protein
VFVPQHARADTDLRVPSTFAYSAPAEENRIRALLELTGVYTVGFTFYLATNRLLPDYDVKYSWPVFREKLLGAGFELDINGLNTNFVGHPLGGSMYYTMARSNQLNVAESTAFAIGGSFLWELFGEVREYISTNDMIVTPLAGLAIAEPVFQLGAFFDRCSPRLHNRILGALFAPVKTLNDWLDDRGLARTLAPDAWGFPTDEYHRFDLRMGAAAVTQALMTANRTFEARLSLASQLIRLPGYDRAGEHSLIFSEANVSSVEIDAALNGTGLVDLELHTWVGVAGYYQRSARETRGQGTLVSVAMGYQYVLHDYDRDRPWPRDRISSIQPLALVVSHRRDLAWVTLTAHVEGGLDFGGLRPYALPAYEQSDEAIMLTTLVENNAYCFVRGAHLVGRLLATFEQVELAGRLRYERYEGIDLPVAVDDSRLMLEGRVTLALSDSPARLGVVVQRRVRKGAVASVEAARSELSVGLELGATY